MDITDEQALFQLHNINKLWTANQRKLLRHNIQSKHYNNKRLINVGITVYI